MSSDPYAVCPECGLTYHVCEGHDCEYGTWIPAVDSVRCRVQDQDDNDVEITVDYA